MLSVRYTHFMQKLSFGVFAHIDAGKTTLSERILLEAGAIRRAGSVDGGTSATDFLPVERRRGISVRDASVSFSYGETDFTLIDTPGHADFTEETELALGAVDVGVLLVSAADGVQARTRRLFARMEEMGLPVVLFLNKCDRVEDVSPLIPSLKALALRDVLPLTLPAGDDPQFMENAVTLLGDEALLERFLAEGVCREEVLGRLMPHFRRGDVLPLICGSARTGAGVKALLGLLARYRFERDETSPFSAFVYQVSHRDTLGAIAHVRVLRGGVRVRGEVLNRRTGALSKVTQLKRIRGERYCDGEALSAGDVGAILGLADVRAGDVLGEEAVCPPALSEPYLRVKVVPARAEDLDRLRAALGELASESPSLCLEWAEEKRELVVSTSGAIRTEVLKETLRERFGIEAETGAPSVIYRETPIRAAYGFEAYTMPKPCWAVVKFLVEPLPRGSGYRFESVCSEKRISYRYQHHVEACVPRVLKEGRLGWQVTDLKVTLVDGEDHPVHTHPLDFFVATPVGVMDALRNAGTRLLEPVLSVSVSAPEEAMGKILGELSLRRGKFGPPDMGGGEFTVVAEIPAAEALDLSERVAMLSGGRAVYDAALLGYFPCPKGKGEVRERTSLDPLDRAKWILHNRGAL